MGLSLWQPTPFARPGPSTSACGSTSFESWLGRRRFRSSTFQVRNMRTFSPKRLLALISRPTGVSWRTCMYVRVSSEFASVILITKLHKMILSFSAGWSPCSRKDPVISHYRRDRCINGGIIGDCCSEELGSSRFLTFCFRLLQFSSWRRDWCDIFSRLALVLLGIYLQGVLIRRPCFLSCRRLF